VMKSQASGLGEACRSLHVLLVCVVVSVVGCANTILCPMSYVVGNRCEVESCWFDLVLDEL
jgi:hypothetical protein